MMGLTADDLAAVIQRLNAHLPDLEQDLNRADARLGDGDTGTMLARVISAMAAVEPSERGDVGTALSNYGRATAMATGSSLGTLIATGLLAAAKPVKGQVEVAWVELAGLLATARDAMLARGGASLGDKTVLDGLHAVARAVEGVDEPAELAEAARDAMRVAIDEFRHRPNKIGRARMFEDGSKGLDDPGMLALMKIVEIVGGD